MVHPSKSVWRVAIFLVLSVAVGGLVVLAGPPRIPSPGFHAQKKDKPKKRSEDEDDTPRPVNPEVTRIDDPDDKPTKEKSKAAGNLKQAARDPSHKAAARKLFSDLAVPHDEVFLRGKESVLVDGQRRLNGLFRIAPLVELFDKNGKGKVTFQGIDEAGEPTRKITVDRKDVTSIHYHEEIAAERVTDFLGKTFDNYGRDEQIHDADTALSGVLQMHQSAVEREARKGPGWDKIELALRGQLLKVKLLHLDSLIENLSWDGAFDLVGKLVESFTQPEEQKAIAKPLTELVKKVLKDPTYELSRLSKLPRRLRFVEDQFGGTDVLKPIRDSLRERAQALFDRAKMEKEKNKTEAGNLLRLAEEICPDLPGLSEYRLDFEKSYPILKVGMRELPIHLSPGLACTDAERRASELIFESLVTLTPDSRGMMYYRPMLAEGRPGVIALGRRFKLPREAKWSDGRAVTVQDVRFTLNQLKGGQGSERGPAWSELIDRVQVEGDPLRFQFRLGQGLLDPFSAMSFKVLPFHKRPQISPDGKAFAENPVGSGPFRLVPRSEMGTRRDFAQFKANPFYGTRPDRLGRPNIRELHIYATLDPVKEMRENRLDMAVDLTGEQAAALDSSVGIEVKWPTSKTPNRRIYFLAINHRKGPLANADLRLALALAIDREKLLDEHFRKDLGEKAHRTIDGPYGKKVHRAINGPYPAGSWACNPLLTPKGDQPSLDPFDADLAKTKARKALKTLLQREIRLTLKYPDNDPVLDKAIEALCKQVNGTLSGVHLTPESRTPVQLRDEVERTISYELAYYSYEFPDEGYWLQPLLGPSGRFGGDNYLGYTGSLGTTILSATTVRHFSQVREFAHAIHRQMLESDMPLIPLWQLDPLIAVHKGRVEMPAIDPQALFTRVEEWRVRTGR